jgi:hypothetical protein
LAASTSTGNWETVNSYVVKVCTIKKNNSRPIYPVHRKGDIATNGDKLTPTLDNTQSVKCEVKFSHVIIHCTPILARHQPTIDGLQLYYDYLRNDEKQLQAHLLCAEKNNHQG